MHVIFSYHYDIFAPTDSALSADLQLSKNVDIGDGDLDLSPYMSQATESRASSQYTLTAVGQQESYDGTLQKGHCNSVCKSPVMPTWMTVDDRLVREAIAPCGQSTRPYILFYQRV